MNDDWVQFTFQIPNSHEEFDKVYAFAKSMGFVEVDFCVMQREKDYAQVDYDPCPPRTESGYTIPPFGKDK